MGVVNAPGFGDRRMAILEDIAVLTGGQAIGEAKRILIGETTSDHDRENLHERPAKLAGAMAVIHGRGAGREKIRRDRRARRHESPNRAVY